jgi:hypothetical protein
LRSALRRVTSSSRILLIDSLRLIVFSPCLAGNDRRASERTFQAASLSGAIAPTSLLLFLFLAKPDRFEK